ncbi:MAG: hypothetical protein K2X39_05770, partial [Silvanigrellaceae bacterium]|nr:hypothetical protein [Silvanigrellaceae bacterium]
LTLYKPLGVILFKRSFQSLEQARNLIQEIRQLCSRPQGKYFIRPVIAIDEEGGRVSRLPSPFPRGESAMSFANRNDFVGLKNQVLHQIFVAKALGVNCILAPVADILTQDNNPALGDRCFGNDAQTVSQCALLVAQTLAAEGMLACAKHFPGHGNTTKDTHKEFATSLVTLETLQTREWIPFQNLIAMHIPMIMTGHLLLPHLDPTLPATLSHTILNNYLRKQLGFQGLILSDDLRMNAIADFYNVQKNVESSITEQVVSTKNGRDSDCYLPFAALDSLRAGCDIILSCLSIDKEKIIYESFIKEMKTNPDFFNYLVEKAFKINTILLKNSY